MSQQGERPAAQEDDWWRRLYDESAPDTGASQAADSLDDRFDSASDAVGREDREAYGAAIPEPRIAPTVAPPGPPPPPPLEEPPRAPWEPPAGISRPRTFAVPVPEPEPIPAPVLAPEPVPAPEPEPAAPVPPFAVVPPPPV
ncbi:hypothetical protein AAIO99_33470, partial [Streptomyces sp. AC154]